MQKEVQELISNHSVHAFFDFGTDAFGTLEIELDGEFSDNTEVVIGEIAKDGKIVHEPGFTTFIQHIFQLRNGHHIYRIPIPKHIPANYGFRPCRVSAEIGGEIAPFRYVEVNRHYGQVIARRTVWHCDWDENASDFESDNEVLNRIWKFTKYSIKATSVFDCYVDGERERKPYEGDAYITQLGHFCCDTNFELARNTIQYFIENGALSWPTEWILLTPILLRDYLLYSGDEESVKNFLPFMDEKLLPQFMTSDGLLSPATFEHEPNIRYDANGKVIGIRVQDIVDFPPMECDHYEKGIVNFVPNVFLYEALRVMSTLTKSPNYQKRAEALRNNIRLNFLHNGKFVDSIGSCHTALHTVMTALLFDIAEGQDEVATCRKVVESKGMACSVYGAQHLLDCCYRHQMADYALRLLTNDGTHSWLNMLREGATMTMEGWGDLWRNNQDWSHAWGAAPANVIPRRLCGIRPVAPGFRTFVVEPQPGTLDYFMRRQPTIHGPIELNYKRGKELILSVPNDTTAIYRGKKYPAGTHRLPL